MDAFKTELEALLVDEHSRERTEEVALLIGGDADRFAVAWDVFCNGQPPLPQRMAWVLDLVTEAHPSLAARYAATIAARLAYMQHPAEARAATKILARTPLPSTAIADILPLLFQWLEDPQVQIAIRCNAMDILYKISQLEPDLKRELALVIELQLREGSPGMHARAKRILPRLQAELAAMDAAEQP